MNPLSKAKPVSGWNSSAPDNPLNSATPVSTGEYNNPLNNANPVQTHSPWSFNFTDPNTGQVHPNYLPRGFSNVLFNQTGNLLDFFGAEETADTLRATAENSFGSEMRYDWEDVKEEDIGILETIKRGGLYGLDSQPASLGYLAMMAPGMGVGGAATPVIRGTAAALGTAPAGIAELERVAQARARADGVPEGVDPTLAQYGAAAPSALANITLDRFAAKLPFTGKLKGAAGVGTAVGTELGTEFTQGGLEEFATKFGTQSQPQMDILDAGLAEAVAVGPQAVVQGVASTVSNLNQSAATANQSPFTPEANANPNEMAQGQDQQAQVSPAQQPRSAPDVMADRQAQLEQAIAEQEQIQQDMVPPTQAGLENVEGAIPTINPELSREPATIPQAETTAPVNYEPTTQEAETYPPYRTSPSAWDKSFTTSKGEVVPMSGEVVGNFTTTERASSKKGDVTVLRPSNDRGATIRLESKRSLDDPNVQRLIKALGNYRNLPNNYPISIKDDGRKTISPGVVAETEGTHWHGNKSGKSQKVEFYLDQLTNDVGGTIEEIVAEEIGIHGLSRMAGDVTSKKNKAFWDTVYKQNKSKIGAWTEGGRGKFYRNEPTRSQAEEWIADQTRAEVAEVTSGKRKSFSRHVKQYIRYVATQLEKMTGKKYTSRQVQQIIVKAAERSANADPDSTITSESMWSDGQDFASISPEAFDALDAYEQDPDNKDAQEMYSKTVGDVRQGWPQPDQVKSNYLTHWTNSPLKGFKGFKFQGATHFAIKDGKYKEAELSKTMTDNVAATFTYIQQQLSKYPGKFEAVFERPDRLKKSDGLMRNSVYVKIRRKGDTSTYFNFRVSDHVEDMSQRFRNNDPVTINLSNAQLKKFDDADKAKVDAGFKMLLDDNLYKISNLQAAIDFQINDGFYAKPLSTTLKIPNSNKPNYAPAKEIFDEGGVGRLRFVRPEGITPLDLAGLKDQGSNTLVLGTFSYADLFNGKVKVERGVLESLYWGTVEGNKRNPTKMPEPVDVDESVAMYSYSKGDVNWVGPDSSFDVGTHSNMPEISTKEFKKAVNKVHKNPDYHRIYRGVADYISDGDTDALTDSVESQRNYAEYHSDVEQTLDELGMIKDGKVTALRVERYFGDGWQEGQGVASFSIFPDWGMMVNRLGLAVGKQGQRGAMEEPEIRARNSRPPQELLIREIPVESILAFGEYMEGEIIVDTDLVSMLSVQGDRLKKIKLTPAETNFFKGILGNKTNISTTGGKAVSNYQGDAAELKDAAPSVEYSDGHIYISEGDIDGLGKYIDEVVTLRESDRLPPRFYNDKFMKSVYLDDGVEMNSVAWNPIAKKKQAKANAQFNQAQSKKREKKDMDSLSKAAKSGTIGMPKGMKPMEDDGTEMYSLSGAGQNLTPQEEESLREEGAKYRDRLRLEHEREIKKRAEKDRAREFAIATKKEAAKVEAEKQVQLRKEWQQKQIEKRREERQAKIQAGLAKEQEKRKAKFAEEDSAAERKKLQEEKLQELRTKEIEARIKHQGDEDWNKYGFKVEDDVPVPEDLEIEGYGEYEKKKTPSERRMLKKKANEYQTEKDKKHIKDMKRRQAKYKESGFETEIDHATAVKAEPIIMSEEQAESLGYTLNEKGQVMNTFEGTIGYGLPLRPVFAFNNEANLFLISKEDNQKKGNKFLQDADVSEIYDGIEMWSAKPDTRTPYQKKYGAPETIKDINWFAREDGEPFRPRHLVNFFVGKGEIVPDSIKNKVNDAMYGINDNLIEKYGIDLTSLSITGLTGLQSQNLYLEKRYEMFGKYLKSANFASQVYQIFGGKSNKEYHSAVFDYLTGVIQRDQLKAPADVVAMAVKLKNQIDSNAQQLIRQGALSQEALEGGNNYLPRMYLKHVLGKENYNSLSGGGSMSNQNYLKKRVLKKAGDKIATGKVIGPDGKAYDMSELMGKEALEKSNKRLKLWEIKRDEWLENNYDSYNSEISKATSKARTQKAKKNAPYKEPTNSEINDTELTKEESQKINDQVEAKLMPASLLQKNKPKTSPINISKEEATKALKDPSNKDWKKEYHTVTKEEAVDDDNVREIMGEIVDPGYLGATTVSNVGRDIATADFLTEISQAGNAWILEKSVINVALKKDDKGVTRMVEADGGKKVSSVWLKREASIMAEREASGHMTQEAIANSKAVREDMVTIANRMEEEMRNPLPEDKKAFDKKLKQYRQVPNSPKYGVLAGMYIDKRIYNDLFSKHNSGQGNKYWKAAEQMHGWWKIARVPLNPPTIMRNVMSNMVLMTLDGMSPYEIGKYVVQSFNIMRAQKGPAWDAAQKYGIQLQTFSNQEMGVISKEFRNMAADNPKWKQNFWAIAKVVSKATDFYGHVETWQKIAVIQRHLDEGATDWEAVQRAQDALFDYSLLNAGAKAFRKVPIGAPFLSFSLLSFRRMGQVVSKNPLRLLPWYLMTQAMWSASALVMGVDDDDLDDLHDSLPEYLSSKPSVLLIPLPMRDAEGRVQFVDISYTHPFGIHWEMIKQFMDGDIDELAQTMGIMGAPLLQLGIAMVTGEDPFTKKEITSDGYPISRKIMDRFNYLWRQTMPTMLTWGENSASPLYKMYEAATGIVGTSKLNYGEAKHSMGQALARMVGINTYGVDPELTAIKNVQIMQYQMADLDAAYKRDIRGVMAQANSAEPGSKKERKWLDKADKLIAEYTIQKMALAGDMQEMMDLSEIHPNLRIKDMK